MDDQDSPKSNLSENIVNSTQNSKDQSDLRPRISAVNRQLVQQTSLSLSEYAVELNNASASWISAKEPSEMTLKNISLRVRRNKLCAIIGPVGSGKVRSNFTQFLLYTLLRLQ